MKIGRRVFILFVLLGVFSWILFAFLDEIFFVHGNFLDMLFLRITPHELFIRFLIFMIFIICGLLLSSAFSRLEKNERALKASEEKFRTLSDQSLLGILIFREGEIIYMNSALAMLFDIELEETEGRDFQYFVGHIYSEDREFVMDQVRRKISGEPDIIPRYTFRLLTEKGNLKWVDLFSRRIMIEDRPALFTTTVDITDRIRAEMALSEEKERLDVTLRSIGDGVIVTDPEGAIISLNRVAEELTGWSEDEAIGRPLDEVCGIINIGTGKSGRNLIEEVLKAGSVVTLEEPSTLVSKDGKERMISDSCAVVRDRKGNVIGTVLVFRDCTETRKLQEFVSRAQRLETAGRIAAQVAHDFNNLLGPLTAYPALIKAELPPNHPALELIDQIEKSAVQIAEINQQLLTLGRRGHYVQKPMNLNKVVLQAVRHFHSLSESVSIKTDLAENLLNIRAGSSQIFRVLANLISNAFDAMLGTGKLLMKTENFYVDRNCRRISPRGSM